MKKICICTTISITMKSFVVPTAIKLHKQLGYDVTLICSEDDKFESSLPDFIHFIPVHMDRGVGLSSFKSIIEFIKIFKREKFDLVQYSTPNAACYASIAAKICRVPTRLYCQWGIRYVGLSGFSRKIFKFIEKVVCLNSTDIRSVSYKNKDFAVSEGLYSAEKSKVIGNGGTIGVDLKQYNILEKPLYKSKIRKQYNISDIAFVYGFVGRVSADKGCSELLTAFKKIAKSNSDAVLLIIGPVEDKCGIAQEILEWARNSKQVIMTGIVDKSKMNEYYSALDVLVHPTYREGFGMVLQEAGALGIAIITTDIPGASEVMEKNISCILVKPKSQTSLYEGMHYLYNNKDVCKNIGLEARKKVEDCYERNMMIKSQIEDYQKLISGRGNENENFI